MKSKLWQKISLVKKKTKNKKKTITPYSLKKASLLVHSLFPASKVFRFILISVKMDIESKVISFWFQPERSISNREGFYQDSSDEGNTTEQDMFVRKDCDPSAWWMCRNCSTMKTEKECLCYHEVEAVCDFNLQGIFVPSQAIILLDLTHNLKISIFICFCN